MELKFKFELKEKFEPYFTSNLPIFLTSNNTIYCAKTTNDSLKISVLSGRGFSFLKSVDDDNLVTSYVVNPSDETIILSTKNLLLKRLSSSLKTKIWRSCHQRPVYKMALNSNSTRLATGSGDTTVRLWHLGDKEGYTATCRFHHSMPTLLCFHPEQPYLFSSAMGENDVVVWNSETGAKLNVLEGHQSCVTDIAFDHTGSQFATCGRDKVIIIWSCPGFTRCSLIPTFESLETCVFLPRGSLENYLSQNAASNKEHSLLMTGGQRGCLRIWNIENGRCVLEVRGPQDRTPKATDSDPSDNSELLNYGLHSIVKFQLVNVFSCTPNDSSIASSGSDVSSVPTLVLVRQSNHIEFYNAMTAKLTSECLGDIGQVDQLCIAGKKHNRLVLADASPHLKLFLNPPGLASSTETSSSWSCYLVTGGHTDVITDLSVSGCGQWLATGGKDHRICLWRMIERESTSDGSLKQPMHGPEASVSLVNRLQDAHAAHICAVCFDKSATRLISCCADNVLKVWSVEIDADGDASIPGLHEWTAVYQAHKATINAIDVSINNQLVATASRDKTVKIWNFTGTRLECLGTLHGHRRGVWSVCFSKLEKLVLTASGDGDIRLWNLKDFSCIKTLEGQDQPVYKAVFLSNDRQILSCDQKGLVRLWDVSKPNSAPATGDVTAPRTFEAHDGRIWSIALCPDELGFYTGGEDETLCYFNDITQKIRSEQSTKLEDFIQTKQALDNLLQDRQYSKAIRLSIKLDQPKRLLDIFEDLILIDPSEPDLHQKAKQTTQARQLLKLTNVLNEMLAFVDDTERSNELHNDQLVQRLMGYLINWNTRSRTSMIAQYVLNWILTHWSPTELLKWPGFSRTIESLLPYTSRHYQRISRLEEQLALLDYLCDLADEHHVTHLGDSNNPNFTDPLDIGTDVSSLTVLTLDTSGHAGMDVD